MPGRIIYLLALISTLYMLYSFTGHFAIKQNYRPNLKFIVLANSFYCSIILTLVYYFYTSRNLLLMLPEF